MLSNFTWTGIVILLLIAGGLVNAFEDIKDFKSCAMYERSSWKCANCNNFDCTNRK